MFRKDRNKKSNVHFVSKESEREEKPEIYSSIESKIQPPVNNQLLIVLCFNSNSIMKKFIIIIIQTNQTFPI